MSVLAGRGGVSYKLHAHRSHVQDPHATSTSLANCRSPTKYEHAKPTKRPVHQLIQKREALAPLANQLVEAVAQMLPHSPTPSTLKWWPTLGNGTSGSAEETSAMVVGKSPGANEGSHEDDDLLVAQFSSSDMRFASLSSW